jgi:hypothetical protein
MFDHEARFLGSGEPAFIVLDGKGGGTLAIGAVTGVLHGGIDAETVVFIWDGSDAMDEVGGHGWVEMQPDGSLVGQISFDTGEETDIVARPWNALPTIH